MTTFATPEEIERARVMRLQEFAILDTEPEKFFDSVTRLAAEACEAPIALICLVDTHRQWFKSTVGLPGVRETPREIAFCSHAIQGSGIMEVADAQSDYRFADNPLVTGDPMIRFYAGAPLVVSDDIRLGTLCVIDRKPRRLSAHQRSVLDELAVVVAEALEFRARAINALEAAKRTEARLERLYAATPAMMHSIDRQGHLLTVSETWLSELGYTRNEVIGRPIGDFFLRPWPGYQVETGLKTLWDEGRRIDIECQMVRADGTVLDVVASAFTEEENGESPARALAVVTDVTARRRAERDLVTREERYRALVEDQSELVALVSPEGNFRLVNRAFAAYLGREPDAIIGTSAFDCVTPEDRARDQENFAKICRGLQTVRADHRMAMPDGTIRWVAWTSRPIVDARGKLIEVHIVGRDVTEIKEMVEALRSSQSFLHRTGEVAGIGGWELVIETQAITWSEQTCRLHDMPLGHSPTLEDGLSYYSGDARLMIERAVEEAMKSGTPYDLELPLVSASGRQFWARAVGSAEFVDGKPVRLVGAFQDITRRKEMERELSESRELLQVTLDSIGDAVITTNLSGRVQWLNPIAEQLTGWSKEEAFGRPIADIFVIIHEEFRQPVADPVALCLAEGKIITLADRTLLVSRDGREYGIEDSASPIRAANGEIHGAVLVFHDVSEQRRLSSEMRHRATHDPLTALINRSEFENRLARLFAHINDEGRASSALMYIDLDQFKLVNDTCGHSVGDRLLQQVSKLIQGCVRGRDTVARLGGDEFGVILEHCDATQARRVAQSICDQMEQFRFVHDERRFRIGASIGLVPVDDRWQTMEAVLQAADGCCYAAKDAGRNRVHAWSEGDYVRQARHGEMQWVSRLEQALDEDRFELYAQRIEAIDGHASGLHCEVLLRLRDADGSMIPAGSFLPAAERFHMATRIDRWVVRQVFARLERAARSGVPVEMIAINLSGQSIGDRAFHRDIRELIDRAKFDVHRLCLEITETAAITNLADAKLFIDEMRSLGVRIALDDFGAGASSFGYLKTLPVDFLKIDGQFVANLLEDGLDYAAVRCFNEVAKAIGVKTIAEFVEREDVRDALCEIGVTMVQGYLIHRPAPLASLLTKVSVPEFA